MANFNLFYKMPVTVGSVGPVVFESPPFDPGESAVLQALLQTHHMTGGGVQIQVQLQTSGDGEEYLNVGAAMNLAVLGFAPLAIPATTPLMRFVRAQVTLPTAGTHVVFSVYIRLLPSS